MPSEEIPPRELGAAFLWYDYQSKRPGTKMGDRRHNGAVSQRDLDGIIIKVLNTTKIKGLGVLTRLQVAIEMRAPINGLSRTINS